MAASAGPGYDNPLLKRVPWRIEPGVELRIGEAVIRREEYGDVEACDLYGCARARVAPERVVEAHPVPAVYRILEATPYIYVEFEDRLYVEDGGFYWTLAPYDIEVYVGGLVLTRVSPVRVKFTLVGDVVEGILARHLRSPATWRREDLPDPTGTAVVGFRVRGTPALLPGVGFNAGDAFFYVDDEGFIYYPLIEVQSDDGVVTAKTTDKPPLPGLRLIQRARRRAALLPQRQDFIMTIEVVRRRLTTQ